MTKWYVTEIVLAALHPAEAPEVRNMTSQRVMTSHQNDVIIHRGVRCIFAVTSRFKLWGFLLRVMI